MHIRRQPSLVFGKQSHEFEIAVVSLLVVRWRHVYLRLSVQGCLPIKKTEFTKTRQTKQKFLEIFRKTRRERGVG